MRPLRIRAPQLIRLFPPFQAQQDAPRRSRRRLTFAAATLGGLSFLALCCAALTLAAAGAGGPQAARDALFAPEPQALASELSQREIRLKFAYEDRLFALRGEIKARDRDNARLQAALAALEQQSARLDARLAALAAMAARLDPAAKSAAVNSAEAQMPQQLGLRGADREPGDQVDGPQVDSQLAADRKALSRIDAATVATAQNILAPVAAENARVAAALDELGLTPERLAPQRLAAPAKAAAPVGGPYEPWTGAPLAGATPFERAFGALNAALARRAFLRAALPHAPLRAPLYGPHEVSSGYGYRTDPFFGRPALHSGVDFVGGYGETVRAAASGAVTMAGEAGGYGALVEIDHGGGLVTRYGHLSEIFVVEGQKVAAGATIGALGSSGRSTGPHLHYEIRDQGAAVDPAPFLKAGRLIDPTS